MTVQRARKPPKPVDVRVDWQHAIHAIVREVEVVRGPRKAKPVTQHLMAAIAALEKERKK